MKSRTVMLGLLAVGIMFVGTVAQSQVRRSRQIAVALVETLAQPELRAEILRFSDETRPDVILLRRDAATAEDLAAAIVSYRRSIARTPARPGLVGRTAVTRHAADSRAVASLRGSAAQMLAKVRRAPLSRVGNYGQGRWSTFDVKVRG